jgi:D-alanine-D-alanine ligase
MMEKINVGVLFGGKSGEHEVSLVSAFNVMNAMDGEKYNIIKIGITKQGQWLVYNGPIENIKNNTWQSDVQNVIKSTAKVNEEIDGVDIFFPVLHGPNGEDGTVQGYFEVLAKPYVGCGVFASSAGMDKVAAKVLFENAGIPIVPYVTFYSEDWETNKNELIKKMEEQLAYPIFIKPVNMGSSVGINKVKNKEDLAEAVDNALKYDNKVLAEKFINAREIECAVLGNYHATASTAGEIIPSREFYDYASKYLDGDESRIEIPANITKEQMALVKTYALKAFKAIDGSGLSRVDFFIDKDDDRIYINEINTMPGFTQISMYPKMVMYDGISYQELIETLIKLGFSRHEKHTNRKTEL